MINEETLMRLYDTLLVDEEITTKTLNSYGFHSTDLTNLIKRDILKRTKRGSYALSSIDTLYAYGKKQMERNNREKALAYFLKCYEFNQDYLDICYQLFLIYIQKKDYEKAFEYFEHIYTKEGKTDYSDEYFYLYLLSMITEVPEQHKQFVRFLRFEDMKIHSKNENTPLQNKIRISAFNQRFVLAKKQLSELKEIQNFELSDRIIEELLSQALEKQDQEKKGMLTLISHNQYQNLVAYLEEIQERHPLRLTDEYTLILTKTLVKMINGEIPAIKIYDTDNLFQAIDGDNYILALSLSKKHLSTECVNPNDNSIHVLLVQIEQILKGNKKTNGDVKQKLNLETLLEPNIENIIRCLQEQNVEEALYLLRIYLTENNRRKCEFLFFNIIKISYMEDPQFLDLKEMLEQIKSNCFEFHLAKYIQKFYEALTLQKLEQARLYLDILSNSYQLGQPCIVVSHLKQLMSNEEKTESSLYTILEDDDIEYEEVLNPDFTIENKLGSKKIDLYALMEQKLVELEEKKVVLLEPMISSEIEEIEKIARPLPDVVCFTIGSGLLRQVVLRKKIFESEYVSISTIIDEVHLAYQQEDYDLCIEKAMKLITFGTPKSWVYAKIGLSYMKKFDYVTAIDYLTIADFLSKEENKNLDYTGLICHLKEMVLKKESKTFF